MKYSDKSLSISFPLATGKTFPVGASVALNAAGSVDTPSSHLNNVGIVTAIDNDLKRVTVATPFCNVVKGIAQANLSAGTLVKENFSLTQSNGVVTFQASAANDYVVGMALTTATAGAEVEIGLFLAPVRRN